jgi:hypothetical protein
VVGSTPTPTPSIVDPSSTPTTISTGILKDGKQTGTSISNQTLARAIPIPTVIGQSHPKSNSCNNRQTTTISQPTKITKGIGVSLPHGSSIANANDENDPLINQSNTQSNSCNNRQTKTVSQPAQITKGIGVSSPNCFYIANSNDENDVLIGGNQGNQENCNQDQNQLLIVQNSSGLSESYWGGTLQQCGLNNLQSLARTNRFGLESLTFVQTSFLSSSLCQGSSSYRDLQSFI